MVKEPTVFILGAGASCPYGFPTGKQLRTQIIREFISDMEKWMKHKKKPQEIIDIYIHQAQPFVETFKKSSDSIDLFLSQNPEFENYGKPAIVFRILLAEYKSHFREDIGDQQKDWYSHLYSLLKNKLVRKDDYKSFSGNNVSFITFNYDRSLEHFLYDCLCHSFYGIDSVEIIKQLNAIPFIHVFGQIAPLPWQKGDVHLEYRTPSTAISDMDTLQKNIHTIYENQNNPSLQEAQKLISEANKVFFLGFGYAEENIKLLEISNCLKVGQQVYGTALGAIEPEIRRIKKLFFYRRDGTSEETYIHDCDCLHLLREYLSTS